MSWVFNPFTGTLDNSGPTSGGSGDMTKAVYDADNDGIVNEAAVITGQGALATLDTVGTAQIDNFAITNSKLANGAVGSTKLSTAVQNSLALAGSALQSADIGTSVQAYDGDLQAIAGLTPSNGDVLYYNSGWQRLAKGTDDQVLTLASGIPSWADAGGGGGTSVGAVATMSSTQILGSGWQKIDFDTEEEDLGGDYDTGTQRFTVPSGGAGLYSVGHKVYCSAAVNNIAIYKNGSNLDVHTAIPANNTREQNSVFKFADGDYIEYYINASSTTIYSGRAYIYKIS